MWFLPSQTPWNDAFLLNIWSHDQCFFYRLPTTRGGSTYPLAQFTPVSPNLLSSSISTTIYQGKCDLAYTLTNTVLRIQKPYIHAFTELCWLSWYRPHPFLPTVFFFVRYFAKCHKLTFSNSSQAITSISMKHCTQHLCTLLTKTY